MHPRNELVGRYASAWNFNLQIKDKNHLLHATRGKIPAWTSTSTFIVRRSASLPTLW